MERAKLQGMNPKRVIKGLVIFGLVGLAAVVVAVATGTRIQLTTVLLAVAQGLFCLTVTVYLARNRERLKADFKRMEEPWSHFAVLLPYWVYFTANFMIMEWALHRRMNDRLLAQALTFVIYFCSFGVSFLLGVSLGLIRRNSDSKGQ
jgi:uncharacterized membrane protein